MVEEPRSAKHIRMFIVTDNKAQEYRMFFMTEEDEEDSSDWPGVNTANKAYMRRLSPC